MLVANDRVEEYKAAGHRLAADLGTKPSKAEPIKTTEAEEAAVVIESSKKAVRKKK